MVTEPTRNRRAGVGSLRRRLPGRRTPSAAGVNAGAAPPLLPGSLPREKGNIDLQRRRDATVSPRRGAAVRPRRARLRDGDRDRIRVDISVQRAAVLQSADAELAEVERIVRLEETSTAGSCVSCGAPPPPARRTAGSAASRCFSRSHITQSSSRSGADRSVRGRPPRSSTAFSQRASWDQPNCPVT